MARHPASPVAAVVRFVDAVNRGDLDGLAATLHPDHRLEILDEDPVVGVDANRSAWRAYIDAFPTYVIEPRHLVVHGARVTVLGVTTGSHLGLPDEEERRLPVLWEADVAEGLLLRWAIVEDTPEARRAGGLPLGL
jgi:ketosteroid isomerase-like protein